MPTCKLFTFVVCSIFSSSGNMCSNMPLSIACSTIWNTLYLMTVLPKITPAPEFTISDTKLSAPKAPVTPSLIPSTKGVPTNAKVVKSIASLYRTFGKVTGLLSPQGDREAGIFIVAVAVWTPARAIRPKSVSPTNLWTFPVCFSSLGPICSPCPEGFEPKSPDGAVVV